MDNRIFCVYNLARRVFLSSKVTIADGENQPLKILKVMVSGLALDAESGLWLSPLNATPAVPRLFPFDLVYLDQDHRVLEMMEVLAGVEFPSHRREVASAVVLPLDTLRSTQTQRGDQLIVCLREHADQLITADQPLQTAALAPVEAGSSLHPAAQPQPFSPPAAETLVVPVVAQNPAPSITMVEIAAPDDLQQVQAQEDPVQVQAAAEWATPAAPVFTPKAALGGDEFPADAPAPAFSQAPAAEVDVEINRVPAILPAIEEGDEDLFANWVESPSALIARKVRPSAAEVDAAAQKALASTARAHAQPVNAPASSNLPNVAVTAGVTEGADSPGAPAEAQSRSASETFLPKSSADRTVQPQKVQAVTEIGRGEADPSPPPPSAKPTIKVAIPARAASFTVAQYGMWQVSVPTAVTSRPGSPGNSAVKGAADPGKTESADSEQLTGSTASEAISKPAPGEPAPASTDPNRAALSEGERRASESPTRQTEQTATPAAHKTEDFASRLANALSKAAPDWGTTSGADSGSVLRAAQPQASEASIGNRWRTERVDDATGEPVPAEFAALVQAKLNRLQTRAGESKPLAITPKPFLAKTPSKKSGTVTKPDSGSVAKGAPTSNGTSHPKPRGMSARLRSWFNPASEIQSDRRRAHRRYIPGMVAHYFTGGAPKPYDVADISLTGFYLLTEDRWTPDTMIRMTLQKPASRGGPRRSITVLSRIVRRGSDGVGAEFVMRESLDPQSRDVMPSEATDRFALARFL